MRFKEVSLWVKKGFPLSLALAVLPILAADQTWLDGNANNDWSTTAANWDTGAVWVNGNNALFGGAGEMLDVNGAISVGNITFNADDYDIGDATADGTLTLAGAPSVITVAVSGTNTISEVLAGSGGLSKNGAGVLALTGANSPSTGNTVINAGTLHWGATDVLPSGMVTVNTGATLEWTTTVNTDLNRRTMTISGAGADGRGAVVNNKQNHGSNLLLALTLAGDATVGNGRRMDFYSINTAGYTLTKKGVGNFNMRSVSGSGIQALVVDEGLAQFEGVDAVIPGGITVNTGAFMSVMANNTDRKLTADVTLNNGNLVANWYLQTPTNLNVRFLNPITVNGNSALIIGVNSPVVVDENSGQANMNVEGPLLGSGTLTLNPTNGLLSNPGSYRLRLLTDNTGLTGTLIVDSGNVDVGDEGGTNAVGTLNNGPLVVNSSGTLWFNRRDAQVFTNTASGSGRMVIRNNGSMTFDGNTVGGGNLDVAHGSLLLTNGASIVLSQDLTVCTKVHQTNLNTLAADVTFPAGSALTARAIICGNDTGSTTAELRATINQTGATVATTGTTAEDNGLRLGHYTKANSVYNMSGGSLTIGGGYDLCLATEGKGWFNLTGGDVYTTRVMMNERSGSGGYGKLTVSGGTLHVGAGGMTVDTDGPYSITFGGAGGTLKATADFTSPLNAELQGTDANAATFDPDGHTLTLSGKLQGTGDLVMAGSGTLELTGGSLFSGQTRVNAGTLRLSGKGRLLSCADLQVAAGAKLEIQTIGNALADTATLTVANDGDPATGVLLGAGVAETVTALVLGGVAQLNAGSYGSSTSGADYPLDEYFSGDGVVLLGVGTYWDGTDTTANADGGHGVWDTATVSWDDALADGTSVTWQNVPAANAVFAGTAGTVEVEAGITVGSMAFMTGGYTVADADGNGTLTLSGAPTLWVDTGLDATIKEQLTGSNGFVKAGAGRLTLSATNVLTLSGGVLVTEGTLRWGVSNALPATSSAAEPIIVLPGGTVDFGALEHGEHSRHYLIAGAGVNGIGALVKIGSGSIMGGFATKSVKLQADASIGGTSRFDIYGMDMNGFKLTKTGMNGIRMYQAFNTAGGLDINEGTLYFESVNQVFEGPVTVADGMYLGVYLYTAAPRSFTADITLNGGRMYVGGSTEGIDNSWYGSVTVNGDGSILAGATEAGKYLPGAPCNSHVYSTLFGTGNLYLNRASLTPLSATNRFINLYADNPFTGTVHIERGTCRLLGSGALRFASGIEVAAGVTLDIQNTGDTLKEEAVVVIASDANTETGVILADGVEEHVARLVLGGVAHGEGGGSYGSSASTADHKNDEYFRGTGIIILPKWRGTLLFMR